MFEQLGILGNIVILIVSLVVLMKASNLAISNSVNLASVTGIGKTKIGFLLVAFSTSLPEFFVAIFAIWNPQTIGISVGNVLGSNIANICLILGISFIIIGIKYPKNAGFFTKLANKEVGYLNFGILISALVPLILFFTGYSSQIVGVFLIALFVYNTYVLSRKKVTVEIISVEAEKHEREKYAVKSILGIIGVVVCAYFIVESASILALNAGVPPLIIGGTIVAFGTSVPELATSLTSVRKGFIDLALGNVIGSNFINITLILGLSFLISPFYVDISAFSELVFFSLFSSILLGYILQNSKVGKHEGTILLAIYLIFLAISFNSG